MARNRSSLSKAGSYHEIAEFWDTHDLAEYWDKTKPVEFEVDIEALPREVIPKDAPNS